MAAEHGEAKTAIIDATYLKAHRGATSLGGKKDVWTPDRSIGGVWQPAVTGARRPSCQAIALAAIVINWP